MKDLSQGSWLYSLDHDQLCQIIETQTLWGETVCRVWFPGRDSVVSVPVSRLKPLESVDAGSPDGITYIAAAARVADALTQDVLLTPIEFSVIPLPRQMRALPRAITDDRVCHLLADLACQEQLDKKTHAQPAMAPLLVIRVEGGHE